MLRSILPRRKARRSTLNARTIRPRCTSESGNLGALKLFAERGGESVTTDADGNVYIAAGQIFVYAPDGHFLKQIDVPERPIDLIFGGKDHNTLYILARTSLYAMTP